MFFNDEFTPGDTPDNDADPAPDNPPDAAPTRGRVDGDKALERAKRQELAGKLLVAKTLNEMIDITDSYTDEEIGTYAFETVDSANNLRSDLRNQLDTMRSGGVHQFPLLQICIGNLDRTSTEKTGAIIRRIAAMAFLPNFFTKGKKLVEQTPEKGRAQWENSLPTSDLAALQWYRMYGSGNRPMNQREFERLFQPGSGAIWLFLTELQQTANRKDRENTLRKQQGEKVFEADEMEVVNTRLIFKLFEKELREGASDKLFQILTQDLFDSQLAAFRESYSSN